MRLSRVAGGGKRVLSVVAMGRADSLLYYKLDRGFYRFSGEKATGFSPWMNRRKQVLLSLFTVL
jgi:hypothetical protein